MSESYFSSGAAIYPDTAAGLTVMPGASNAFGSWVELVASAASQIFLLSFSATGTSQSIRMQIGTGAAGSETVVATYHMTIWSGFSQSSHFLTLFPFLLIQSGARIAIRMASNAATPSSIAISIGYIPTANVVNPVLSEVQNPTGAVVSDAGNSATTFKTNLTETVNNYWRDAWVKITSGALINQVKRCTGYDGTTKFITVDGGYTGTPAASATFELVNQ